MAKTKHKIFLDTVNKVFTDAMQEEILHLYAAGDQFPGRAPTTFQWSHWAASHTKDTNGRA
jgi:hypothetical protein